MAAERTLLLVDDEENILSALARLFRRDGYRILRANGGAAGLEVLAAHPGSVGVIISDQRMPGMTGSEFLSHARHTHPDTVRIVLSGYTDLNSVTDAINEGSIYKFLTKPWDDEQLRGHVREAFEHYELKREYDRLGEEVKRANAQLTALNHELEQRVEEKTREVLMNMHGLQAAHDVLESLPVAVIGIADDGLVTIANRLAREWIGSGVAAGQMAMEVLPPPFREALARPSAAYDAGESASVFCGPLSHATSGRVMVVIPKTSDQERAGEERSE